MLRMEPSATRLSLGLVLALTLLALVPAVSHAAVSGSMSIQFPQSVTVGQSAAASITLRNQNTGAEGASANSVCNAGDGGLCEGDPGIVLVASCGALSAGQCAASDGGVFGFPATASGRAGTSCAGMGFSISPPEPVSGSVRLTPDGGAHVILPPSAAPCSIDFTLSAQRTPSVDFDGSAAGVQTVQTGEHTQFSGVLDAPAKVRDTSSGITVQRSAPTLAASVSSDIPLGGGTLRATATVNGRANPVEGATIDFRLYGPDDTTCARAPVYTSLVPYPAGGGSVSSRAFEPTVGGRYRWSTSYSGDANNLPVPGSCPTTSTLVGPGLGDRDGDGVGSAADKCPSLAGDKRNGCPSELKADIRGLWRVNQLLSKLVSLTVRAPVGSRIEVRCKARRGVCPFRTKIVRKTIKRTTGLTRSFGSPRIYPAGTKISVFVTKARRRGTYERVLTRTGRRLPSVVNRCLGPKLRVLQCPR